MGKKQRARKERKEQQKRPGAAPLNWADGEISPQARKIMHELGRGELFRNELQLFEIVTNSRILRDEPEFDDFAFDVAEVTRVVGPLLAAREQDLERAHSIGEQEAFAVYEEARMQAIDALLTRERRREFLRRYDDMLRRLLAGTETDKITTAVVTRSIFDQKDFPWALAGIVIELFEEARGAITDRVENVKEIIFQSLKKQHPDMTDEELEAAIDDSEQVAQAIARIEPSPEQLAELEEMTDQLMEDFERALYSGSIPLDLFHDDELEQVARRLNTIADAVQSQGDKPQTQDLEEFARMLQSFIGEIMTPERQAILDADLTAVVLEWEQSGNPQSMLLEMERDTLTEIEPAENQFIYAALKGQLQRAAGVLDNDEIENAEGELDKSVIDGTVINSIESGMDRGVAS